MMLVDEAYVEARRVLLDAIEALADHRDALVLVGAQAVYLRTQDLVLPTAPYTTDGDIALDLRRLGPSPSLGAAMGSAAFRLDPWTTSHRRNPGQWWAQIQVGGLDHETSVDLLVPASDAPPGGTRGVRLPDHGNSAARKVAGLEAAIWDHDVLEIGALDGADCRRFDVSVAGVAALLVAKAHKLADRVQDGAHPGRLDAKDAADVYRLVVATPRVDLIAGMERLLSIDEAAPATLLALQHLRGLFGRRRAEGIRLASMALAGAVDEMQVVGVLVAMTRDLPVERR